MYDGVMTLLFIGIWLGGLVAIDLIEAPAKFKIEGLDRAAAVRLGQVVFRRFGYLEMLLSGLLLASGSGTLRVRLIVALLSLIALLISPLLRSGLSVLVAKGNRGGSSLRGAHAAYVAADILKMLLLVSLAATLS